MLGNYYTFPELLIWIPLITGLVAVFIRKSNTVKWLALLSSLATLTASVISLFYSDPAKHVAYFAYNNVSYYWLPYIGSSFSVGLDGMGFIVTFLTALTFPLVFLNAHRKEIERPSAFYSLMLLFQAGLMGVFVAYDALVFYFFWELALIPAYFLVSRWGGPKRIAVTYKFFVYTFTGSLLMLIGILYLYQFTPQISGDSVHSFSITALYSAPIGKAHQIGIFLLFFFAFAIKMPIFPFHTWQPDTYEQASYPVVMILSAVMVKMGVFAMIRWILPLFPLAVFHFQHWLVALSVMGIVYGSCIALMQNDLKRLAAWASIAHIGLMGAGIFSANTEGLQGAMLEMFNHGINILGLWLVVSIIENTTGTRKISELGGLAQKSPALAAFFLVILLANIGLPLTNSFVSEFLMLTGVFAFSKWLAAFACIGVILSAAYMLKVMRLVFYGQVKDLNDNAGKLNSLQVIVLTVVVLVILVMGIYPDLILHLANGSSETILKHLGVN